MQGAQSGVQAEDYSVHDMLYTSIRRALPTPHPAFENSKVAKLIPEMIEIKRADLTQYDSDTILVAEPSIEEQSMVTLGPKRLVEKGQHGPRLHERLSQNLGNVESGHSALQLLRVLPVNSKSRATKVGLELSSQADYELGFAHDGSIVLTLHETKAANLGVRRILDARRLRTMVKRVIPIVDDQAKTIQVVIEVQPNTSHHIEEHDNVLWVELWPT